MEIAQDFSAKQLNQQSQDSLHANEANGVLR
jgi:hypothetical protein